MLVKKIKKKNTAQREDPGNVQGRFSFIEVIRSRPVTISDFRTRIAAGDEIRKWYIIESAMTSWFLWLQITTASYADAPEEHTASEQQTLILIILKGEVCQRLTAARSEICSGEWAGFNHVGGSNSRIRGEPKTFEFGVKKDVGAKR